MVSLTCEAEKVGKYSRIRLYTYPSLEIRSSQAPNNDVAGSIPAISATGKAPLFRVEHCHSNRRRLPFIGIKGVGGIVATWKATIEKSHAARLLPCTCHGGFFKIKRLARFTRALAIGQKRAEPLVVSPGLLHPHHALRQELLPFLEIY